LTRDDEAGGKPPPVPTEGDTRLWRQATAGDPPESQFSISDSDGGLEPGTVVDGFRVRRKLGQGGMGAVYLARDLRLGRKVALKLLRPETMGSQEAVERFLFEARTTARFSHPHIVTIYAVGEHEGRPYVALEFLEGQTLRERIQGEQLGLKGSLRVALSIADALAEAHRHGVLHRDLKPENVMIPKDGRIRVVDFGLAKRVAGITLGTSGAAATEEGGGTSTLAGDEFQTDQDGVRGTPLYMAPEQWTNGTLSPATDVWSLGLMTYEMLAGEHPCRGRDKMQICYQVCNTREPMPPLVAEVPPALRDTVARCLTKDPALRPSLEEIREVFAYVLADDRPRLADERSPFPGLLPLDERYAEQFFGRETETSAFLERMRERPVLPVVGPSGAGKSSFVMAGVVPRLREHGRWVVLRLRPGRNPQRALAARLIAGADSSQPSSAHRTPWSDSGAADTGETVDPPTLGGRDLDAAESQLAAELAESPASLALRLLEIADRERAWVLLFVDQLEELCTLCESEEERRTFMDALCLSADDPEVPVRTVFTLRDDFLGRLAAGPVAQDTLSRVTVLRSPGPEALGEILRGVAGSVRYDYDDETLVERIVEDVRGEQAALPLIQFAGQALWRRRDRAKKLLRSDAYEAMGRVAGALALHTDEVLAGLPPPQLRLARALLVRLVSPDGTRLVLPRTELLEGLGEGADELLDRLIQERVLLVRKGGASTDEPEVELVHESLIRSWERLARWLEGSREEMAFLHEVGQAASLWERRGRRPDELWQGDALADGLRRLQRCSTVPSDTVRAFLDVGLSRERSRARRRNTGIAVGFAVLIVLSASLAFTTLHSRRNRALAESREQEAQSGRVEADRKRAEALAEGAQSALYRGDLLEAGARIRESLELTDSLLGRALHWQMSASQQRWTRDLGVRFHDVDFAPDGRTIAAVGETGTVFLLDALTSETRYLRGAHAHTVTVAFSPDSARLATGSADGEIAVWDLATGTTQIFPDRHTLIDLQFSPDGRHLVSGGRNNRLHLWDAATGALKTWYSGHAKFVRTVKFSPGGDRLISGSNDTTVRMWDIATGEQILVMEGHEAEVESVSISPDGSLLASSGYDGTVRIWDARSGLALSTLEGHEGPVVEVAFNPEGTVVASAGHDHTIRLWDPRTGEQVRTLTGHEGWVSGLAFSAASRDLVSSGYDFTLRSWRDAADGGRPGLPTARGHGSEVTGACFTADGERIVSSGWGDRSLRVWDRRTGEQTAVLASQPAELTTVACSPDSPLVATGGVSPSLTLWDIDTGEIAGVLNGHTGTIRSIEFDPSGGRLLSTAEDSSIAVWDLSSGEMRHRLEGHEMGVGHAIFGLDGGSIASVADDGTVRTWDLSTGQPHWTTGFLGRPRAIALDAPRSRCIAVDYHGVYAFDMKTGQRGSQWQADDQLLTIRRHPTYASIGIAGLNGFAALQTIASRIVARPLVGHRGEVRTIAFDPSGQLVLTAGQDGTVRLWDHGLAEPYWRTVTLLASTHEVLTHRGWNRLGEASANGPASAIPAAEVPAWRRALGEYALRAVESSDGTLLCVHRPERWAETISESLEVWDTAGDELLATASFSDIVQIEALDDACLILTRHGLVSRVDRSGVQTNLEQSGRAIRADGSESYAVTETDARIFDAHGEVAGSFPVGSGVTALMRDGDRWSLGYEDGAIELWSMEEDEPLRLVVFQDTTASEVVELVAGPQGTLIAGFMSGVLGVWDTETGSRLYGIQLHGPVKHLALVDHSLYAATDLGDTEVLELDALYMDECSLIEAVWDDSPVVWEGGRAVEREPPADHPCRSAAGES